MDNWIKLAEQIAANPLLIIVGLGILAYQFAQLLIKSGSNAVAMDTARVKRETMFNDYVQERDAEFRVLKGDVKALRVDVENFKRQNGDLSRENGELRRSNGKLEKRVEVLEKSNESLESEVDELRRKLGMEPKYRPVPPQDRGVGL